MKVKHITQYLFESYKDAQAKFAQEASEDEVKQYLDTFKQLAKKGTVSGQEKDIGYWIKQGWIEFKGFVDSKSQEKSKSEVKKSKKKESIIAYYDEGRIVVIPLTKDASCYYGKGTKWCTAATESENHFNDYFYKRNNVLFYVYMKNTGEKYAVTYSEILDDIVYYDEMDNIIKEKTFQENTSFNKQDILKMYEENKHIIKNSMDLNNVEENVQLEAVKDNTFLIQKIDNPSEKIQLEIIKDCVQCIRYIDNPTEKVQLEAIKQRPLSISYIDNPTENVQLEAIKKLKYSIKYIDNPTDKVKQLHKELWEQ